MEKQIAVQTQATYLTKNELTENTKYIWLVCHGYGQLARFFIRRFDVLDEKENYIIAPEGLSKFYLGNDYKKVGASWLTKENRELHLENQLVYLEEIYKNEISKIDLPNVKLVFLGFSQGVATVCRWAAKMKIPFSKLILWAGSFPADLTKDDLAFINNNPEIFLVIGKQDQFLSYVKIDEQEKHIIDLGLSPNVIMFEGEHEVKREVLAELVKSF